MSQTQLYWIIAAVVVLIAIALLITLSSRRRRGAELEENRAADLRRAGTPDPVRDAAAPSPAPSSTPTT